MTDLHDLNATTIELWENLSWNSLKEYKHKEAVSV